jgi:hypothetical protein
LGGRGRRNVSSCQPGLHSKSLPQKIRGGREGERRKDKSREGSLPCGESLKPLARHCLVWDATGAAGSFRDSSVVSFVISEAFQFYRKKLLSFLSDVCSFLFLSLLSPHCEFSIHSQ